MSKTTSDLILERLQEWGIDTCIGLCGDQINGFFESLRTHTDTMRFVHVRHEEAAALAAVGYAKFSGRMAAVVATAGPGAVHLLNGLYDARIDGAPVLALTGLSYHDTIGTHLLQDLPSDRLFAGACTYSERVMGPAHAVPVTDLAVRNAWENRSPVHLAIPIDVQSQTEDQRSSKNVPGHTSLAAQPTVSRPPDEQLHRAAEILNSCDRVAICAGAGARGAGDVLEQVAELLAAPIVKAGLGKDCVPDDSPYTTGGMGLIGTRPSHEAFENCDGFLVVGSSTPYAEFWPQPGQARGVQIDLHGDRIALRYPVEVGLVGDAATTLRELAPLLERKEDRSFLDHAQQGMRDWWDLLRRQAECRDTPMKPQVLTWCLSENLPDGAIVTGDAGTVTAWGGRIKLRRGMQYSFSGTLCSMGSAVPYAIGAQLAHPDRPVVAFTGDGSMSMGMGELATLAQHRLPITVVVVNNGSLAMEVFEQNALLGNPHFACELSPVDFAAVAEGCGVRGYRLEDPAEAPRVLAEALAHDGPCLVDAVVTPHESPMADTFKPAQAEKMLTAFERGEAARKEIAANLLDPGVVAMSPAVRSIRDELARYQPTGR
ncbi:thiamine pyrophosphate-dependent enzyme [Pseudonocardia sp. RS11V-5]|uniref:thiamine pyrophosphate-dependent enzyme n=1 Tax=Pseudonocardia terrae TaxID=2905831 RepID=UPI001E42A4A1|nr:thiamine pyrophosphate-dependent enzyme [Pseudonocardia terrae]MCE3550697.1 thiamine pyrophosphate-dependent enzyme [Pseudonocardia terrae]